MANASKSKQADRVITSLVRLSSGITIAAALTCALCNETNANQLELQRIAVQIQVPVGERGVFNNLSDGCPTLDQLNKLATDTALHDRGSYYQDFKNSGCVDAQPGDWGVVLEINRFAEANKIRLDRDQTAYWFHTIAADGSRRFTAP